MNELEMAKTLGFLSEPEANRVTIDPLLMLELTYLKQVFAYARHQKDMLGSANPDLWCELLPWHSMN